MIAFILALISVTVSGRVVDKKTGKPIEFAVVILYDTKGSQVTGTYTDSNGVFALEKVKPGKYYIVADFIGYEKSTTDTFEVDKGIRDIGVLKLSPSYIKTRPVVSKAQASRIRHEVDRTIVTPSRDIVSSGGNASDVLKNVPGVSVSPTGEVLIKNSSNYTVLINNKPTMLPADQALKQIPASQIEKIEIITNPSAEYDPESNAIINIVLKKAHFKFGNSFTVRLGTFKNYGASFTWGAEKGKWNFYVIGSYFSYTQPLTYSTIIKTVSDTVTLPETNFTSSDIPASVRFGVIFNPGENTSFTLENEVGRYRLKYEGDFYYKSTGGDYFDPIYGDWKSSFYSTSLEFDKKLDQGSFNGSIYYGYLDSDKLNRSPKIVNGDTIGGVSLNGSGNRDRVRVDLVYDGKIKGISFKTGYRYSLKDFKSTTKTTIYSDTNFTNALNSRMEVQAGFVKFNGSLSKFNYGFGLRMEYMNRRVGEVKIERTDLFPSLYISIPGFSKLNLSYSRRIRRPSSYSINPVNVWETANELHIGNPDLKPEYDDSYEISFEIPIGKKLYLSGSGYYTYEKDYFNKIEEVDTGGIIRKMEENLPYRIDAGLNWTLEWSFSRFMKFSITPDIYWYKFKKLDGEEEEGWAYKIDGMFSGLVIPVGFIQLYLRYLGPYEEPFGKFDPAFIAQFGYMIRIKNISVMLSFLDVFHTMKMVSKNETADGYIEKEMTTRYPTLFISIRYVKRQVKHGKGIEKDFEDIKSM